MVSGHPDRFVRFFDVLSARSADLAYRMSRATVVRAAALLALVSACGDWPAQITPGFRVLGMAVVADNLDNPLFVAAPVGDPRLFIVEREGRIRIVQDGQLLPTPFLSLTSDVSTFGNERGMLGLAFHPDFATNRRFFVTFTGNDGGIHLEEFTAQAASPNLADLASRKVLLNIPTPGVQHYGGMMQFTPDGELIVSIGEGGFFSEPGGEAQNANSLLGKLLRLDVNSGSPYSIPADNPFVGVEDKRPEIWAMGLRNPWRFAVDASTRTLYLADVGDNLFEELNIVPLDAPAVNYGWNYFEGPNCQFTLELCASGEYHSPELDYPHQPPCASITGGMVYRGTATPEHIGRYFYADYCLGWIRSLRYNAGTISEEIDWAPSIPIDNIASFGEDGFGELYAVSLDGRVYRITGERQR